MANATAYVNNGVISSGITLQYNVGTYQFLQVLNGGSAWNITVNSGGLMTVSSGGRARNLTVNVGGSITGLNGAIFSAGSRLSSGGAVVNSGVATINGGTFTANSVGSFGLGGAVYNNGGKLDISGGTFARNLAFTFGNGGGVYNATGIATISSANFTSNSASINGGAVFNSTGGTMTITGGTYTNNFAANLGGALNNVGVMNVVGGVYSGNSATYGGGAFDNGGTATITGANFISNRASSGGAIYNSNGSLLTVINGVFSGNIVSSMGGAIYNSGSSAIVNISGGTFVNNSAIAGGAIYNMGFMTLNNATFATAKDTIYNTSTMTFTGTNTFAGNLYSTKAITATGATVVLDVSSYATANTLEIVTDITKIVGAAAYSVNTSSSQANGNYKLATVAGAFNYTVTVMADANFQNSVALTVNGQAKNIGNKQYSLIRGADNILYLSVATSNVEARSMIVTIANGDLVNAYDNEISLREAMVTYASGGTLGTVVGFANTVTSVTFSSSIQQSISRMTLSGNGAANTVIQGVNGARLTVMSGNSLTVTSMTLNGVTVSSRATVLVNSDVVISGGTVANGGAIFNDSYGSAILVGGSFTGNLATANGGAIYNNNFANMTLLNDVFSGNRGVLGGAIYNQGTATITNVVFSGNSATGNGGAIYNVSSMSIDNGSFMTKSDSIYNLGEMTLRGTITLHATLSTYELVDATGASIVLALNNRTNTDMTLINDYSLIGGAPSYTVTVNGSQVGSYALVGNADAFSQSVALIVDGVNTGINLTVGTIQNYGDNTYSLVLNSGTLWLAINMEQPSMIVTIANGDLVNASDNEISLREAMVTYASGGVLGNVVGFANTTTSVAFNSSIQQSIADMIVSGNGAGNTLVSAANNARIIVGTGNTLTVSALTLNGVSVGSGGLFNADDSVVFSGGLADNGGAIVNNAGIVTLTGGTFSGNSAMIYGGALYNSGTANITGVTFDTNSAEYGGAICNESTMLIENGNFSGNSAMLGGAIYNGGNNADISGVTFSGNTADFGGAIFNELNITLTGGTFSGNSADFGGALYNAGSATLSDVTLVGNSATDNGGAIHNDGTVVMSGVIFSGNLSSNGGALYNAGETTLTDTVFATASDTVYNEGNMTFAGTITLAGNLYSITTITATGASLILDLSSYATANTVEIITDVTKVSGAVAYSVNVAENQAEGSYKLATNAGSFAYTVSVMADFASSLMSIELEVNGQSKRMGEREYALVRGVDNILYLSIVDSLDPEDPSMIVTIADGDLVDAYDYEISLNEALSVYASGGALGTVVGFADTVSSVTFSGVIIPRVSSMTLSGNGAAHTVITGVSGGQIVVADLDKLHVEQATVVGGISLGNGAGVHVLDGGVVSNMTASENGAGILISSGGSAVSTFINNSNASQRIASGGTALYTTLNSGYEDVNGGHAISTVILDGASQEVYDGGIAEYTSVNSGGHQVIISQGVANYTIVDSGGTMSVFDAVANNTTINYGGELIADQGAVFGGDTYLAGTVVLSGAVTANGTVTLGLNERTQTDGVIIDNIANLTNNGTYVVSVTASQTGKYALAAGAATFDDSITLVVDGVDTGISLAVGAPVLHYGNNKYFVTVEGGILYLNAVAFNPIIVTILGDAHIDGENTYRECVEFYAPQGYDEVIFKSSLNGGTVMIANGAVNAAVATVVHGNGVNSTFIAGAATYGNGYGLEINNLTYLNNLAGGSFNASIDGGASLTLDNVAVSNTGTAYATAGSVVSGRLKLYYIDGDVDFNIINTTFNSPSRTVGAGFVDAANLVVTGDVNINVKDSKIVIFYGGGWITNKGTMVIEGDINITLDIGTQSSGAVYAGSYIPNTGASAVEGTTSMTIKSGNFTGVVGNGSYVTAGNESTQKDSVLTIEGGSFARAVYAGGYSNGGVSVVNGNTYLNISGGTFATNVYGGSYGNNAANGDKTLINGSTNITIDCSVNAISFGRYIQAGSAGNGVIIGDTNITFTGLGSNLTFAAGAAVSGESEVARTTNNYVSGDKHINFDNFTGDFNALLVGFTNFTIKGDSQVSYIGGVDSDKLSYVNSWGFALTDNNKVDGALIWDGGINNFSGDSIELAFDSSLLGTGETAKIIDGNAASVITGWDAFGAVSFVIGGVNYAANWSAGDAGYLSSNGWLLSADESNFDLILTKIS